MTYFIIVMFVLYHVLRILQLVSTNWGRKLSVISYPRLCPFKPLALILFLNVLVFTKKKKNHEAYANIHSENAVQRQKILGATTLI